MAVFLMGFQSIFVRIGSLYERNSWIQFKKDLQTICLFAFFLQEYFVMTSVTTVSCFVRFRWTEVGLNRFERFKLETESSGMANTSSAHISNA